jgi:hypothetical protein
MLYVSHMTVEGTKTRALLSQAGILTQKLEERNLALTLQHAAQIAEKDKILAKARSAIIF